MGEVPEPVRFAKVSRVRVVEQKLGRERAWGMASGNTIWLDERLRGQRRLEVTLHELMHLLYPHETEENVDHAGRLLSRILWRQGWRRIEMGSQMGATKK